MKKFFAALFAAVVMMFSTVSAFALESPVATTAPETTAPATQTVTKDTSSTSPKTGDSNAFAYVALGLSLAACGLVAVKAVKSK